MKMKDRLHFGVWYAKNGIIYHAQEVNGGKFILSFHEGEMPAHYSEIFKTAEKLIEKMRSIADLRLWKNVEND